MSDDRIRQEAKAARASLEETAVVKPTEEPAREPVQPVAVQEAVAKPLTIKAAPGGDPRDAEIERLKQEVQKHKVEEGRLKKASEELAELRKEKALLESKVQELTKADAVARPLRHVDPKRREVIDEDVLAGTAEMVEGRVSESERALMDRMAQLEAELRKSREDDQTVANRAFDGEIEKAFPGFIAATSEGGPHYEAWARFLGSIDPATGQPYEATITGAYGRHHLGGVSRVINDFLKDSGIARQAARKDAAQPAGSASGTGDRNPPQGDSTVYSRREAEAILKQSRDDFDRGRITRAQRNDVISKIQTAIDEGRVLN